MFSSRHVNCFVFLFCFDGQNARFQRRSTRSWSEFGDKNRASRAVYLRRGINSAMGHALQTPPPSTMAREPALCAHPPRHASRHNTGAVTARRLFLRTCSSAPLPDQAVAVSLRCWTVDHQRLSLTKRWPSVLIYGKANTETLGFFSRLDPVFARDNSGRCRFIHQGGLDKISYLVSLLQGS